MDIETFLHGYGAELMATGHFLDPSPVSGIYMGLNGATISELWGTVCV